MNQIVNIISLPLLITHRENHNAIRQQDITPNQIINDRPHQINQHSCISQPRSSGT